MRGSAQHAGPLAICSGIDGAIRRDVVDLATRNADITELPVAQITQALSYGQVVSKDDVINAIWNGRIV